MPHTITLIPGDGIGPEVSSAVVRIIEATGVQINWETKYAGAQALEKFGSTLPDDLLESIKRNKVALKGPITTPVGKGFTSVNVGLRKALDLYVNLRPVWSIPSVKSRYEGVNLVVTVHDGRLGAIEKPHLAAMSLQLLQQQDLMNVVARQPVRRGDHHQIEAAGGGAVAQAIETWPPQRGAAVAVIPEDMVE